MQLKKFLPTLTTLIRTYKSKSRMLEIKREQKQQKKRKKLAIKQAQFPFMIPEYEMKEKKIIIYQKARNEAIDIDENADERNRGEEAL
eukprot:gene6319-10326_t